MISKICIVIILQRVLAQPTPLHLGVFLPINGQRYFNIGPAVLFSMEMAVDMINNRTDILADYELKLHISDTMGDPSTAVKQLFQQIYEPPTKIMILGPVFSRECITMAEAATAWNLLQFVFVPRTPDLSDRERFPYFYRTLPDEMVFTDVRLKLLHMYNWRRIAIIYEEETANTFSTAMKELRDQAALENITTVVYEGLNYDKLPSVFEMLKENDARIIFISSYQPILKHTFCQAYRYGLYGAKYVWIVVGWSHASRAWWLEPLAGVTCTSGEMHESQKGHFSLNYFGLRSLNSSDSNLMHLDSDEFMRLHKASSAYDPIASSYIGFAFDAVVSAAVTLNRSIDVLGKDNISLEDFNYTRKDMALTFNSILDTVIFKGMTGPVGYKKGMRVGLSTIEQSQGHGYELVGLYDPYVKKIELLSSTDVVWEGGHVPVDGMQQVISKQTLSSTVVILMVSLASLGILASLVCLHFNIKNRQLKYIKLSSPNLNNLVAVGGILAYTYVILAGLAGSLESEKNMAALCFIQVWILCFGFSIAFGAIFSKTWRVHVIMSKKTAQKKILKDGHLLITIVLVLLVDLIILVPWVTVDPWYTKTLFLSDKADQLNDDVVYKRYVTKCDCIYKSYWTSALYVYKGVFLLFGVFLAWDTRHVRIPALNDSKFIGLSIYNVTLLSIIGAPIGYVIDIENFENSYVINALFIIFSTSITIGLVFVPKMIALQMNPAGEANINTVTAGPTVGTQPSTMFSSGDTSRLQQLVRQQQEKITELETTLKRRGDVNEDDKPTTSGC